MAQLTSAASAEFEHALADAGLAEVEIRQTQRFHEHAGAARIRARKLSAA
jgi:arsenite methyltransferase